MLIRIWRVQIEPERMKELEHFANTYSLPMFRQQTGCVGVLFMRNQTECITISLWENAEAIDRLKTSASYAETVRQIEASGLLTGTQSVEVFEYFGGFLDVQRMAR